MKINGKFFLWVLLVVVAVIALIVIFQKITVSPNNEQKPSQSEVAYDIIPFNQPIEQPGEMVFNTPSEWIEMFNALESPVNFSQKTLVGYSLGMRPNSGYSIQVESIESQEDEIIIHAVSVSPGSDCITMQVITYPKVFVSFSKTSKNIRWDISSRVEDCE